MSLHRNAVPILAAVLASALAACGAQPASAPTSPVPGAKGAYSAWVEEGASHLRWDNGGVVVAGQYAALDAPEQRNAFTAALKPDLNR